MYDFLVTTSKGLDGLLQDELQRLCPSVTLASKPGQVSGHGELRDIYRICLWSRLANRVLITLAEGSADCPKDLYALAREVRWRKVFSVAGTFAVSVNGTNRQINNTQFAALTIKDAIVDQFSEEIGSRPSVDKQQPDVRIHGRIRRDKGAIYLDVAGQSLHMRHYRQQTGEAPLKEHVACAMLLRSGWAPDCRAPLVDPMCGSGTVVIEAAMMAANIAPGLKRPHWGFEHWLGHDPGVWRDLHDEALAARTSPPSPLYANDTDERVLGFAQSHAKSAGVADFITFTHQDACEWAAPADIDNGYLVSNPPYGERLSQLTALLPLFQRWGDHLKHAFKGWTVSLLTSNRDLLRQLKLVANKEYQLMNGKLECQLVNFVLDERNCEVRPNQRGHSDFANRLGKNHKRLSKWARQQNIDCYRVYDADLPEYNVAVDCYADWVVVQEYAAPKDVPEQKARMRLHDVLMAIPEVLSVDPEHIVLKTREQQKGRQQYEKMAAQGNRLEVHEHGAKFWVNLTDYLDTGLFLDHRTTRQWVHQRAKDKDVLNLFAYTGSVSVHAALGGARSVTTVDMSNTYLNWAKDNFRLNHLQGPYAFVQGDCTTWLAKHRQQYDFIFIDPPSFSNSKRMDGTWDVQRDHVALLKAAKQCLRENGQILFSNNLRGFKIDEAGLLEAGLIVKDVSAASLPEDFKRNPRIHRCYELHHV
ncbi:bifunctional 23S rRNA (guanine(2069)-N(7))-methyltransferase RlmK/23S rRNA (guanine(2445)-N(2))-methyltransferase RlmL [Aestuariibacter halophilus]|uniref:Ribosomal RNA large subunit methyltransferase K/L n=1 Tax=Fluctibacter halophilus TaxID=226011 RepID=A0ABS8G5I7_9ALTE|nr:bifunctional 23S rRNA (guanine(2069)-N(7))-methyltransferase RlmK/23S rRNA (guanine(2445)-N(2))-methyltransferase RlmL [Aestuariibacter halophilus]MCC2615678.1 bifunctional 23S rRNA (guanine(2069)-N(7))-methyltransferase RlmK/23S rRNA (guanine(2445)-N(2))-methyltransferase RlmL [Aestuariibacter halophilus]